MRTFILLNFELSITVYRVFLKLYRIHKKYIVNLFEYRSKPNIVRLNFIEFYQTFQVYKLIFLLSITFFTSVMTFKTFIYFICFKILLFKTERTEPFNPEI